MTDCAILTCEKGTWAMIPNIYKSNSTALHTLHLYPEKPTVCNLRIVESKYCKYVWLVCSLCISYCVKRTWRHTASHYCHYTMHCTGPKIEKITFNSKTEDIEFHITGAREPSIKVKQLLPTGNRASHHRYGFTKNTCPISVYI